MSNRSRRSPSAVTSAISFLLCLLIALILARPACAGYWQLDHYNQKGHDTGSDINNVNISRDWDTPVSYNAGGQVVSFGPDLSDPADVHGTIQPVFTWHATSVSDKSPAENVWVGVSVAATTFVTNSDLGVGLVSDGFADAPYFEFFQINPDGSVTYSLYATGQHILSVPVAAGQTKFSLPSYSLSASSPRTEDIGAGVYLYAEVVGADVQAHSTQDTANWDPRHPRFFSGTNCTANGSTSIDASLIRQAQLTINGTVVKTYPDLYTPNATPNLSVTFDSTHFNDGTPIVIKYQIWDTAGDPPVEKQLSADAYNKAEALNNNTYYGWAGLADSAAQWLSGCNYTVSSSTSLQKNDVLSLLPSLTAFYIATHGDAAGQFGDCDALPTSSNFFLPLCVF